jgi:hypothetical protein
LSKEKTVVRRIVSTKFSSLWEMIWGLESKRLAGYGEVDISLKKHLDPAVGKIIKLLNEATDVLYKKPGKR